MQKQTSIILEAVVTSLSLSSPPGFYFSNSSGERAYCFNATGLDGFEALKPGSRVKVAGQWSPIIRDVFEGERIISIEDGSVEAQT
jgi:hypothetical protein